MKIRNDYVSNSSSSSYILAEHKMFQFFNITKQDILDALIDSYGKEAYEHAVEENIRCWKEYNKGEEDIPDCGPIWVYDLSDYNDYREAVSRWGGILKNWDANNVHMMNGKPVLGSYEINEYKKMIESIEKLFRVNEWQFNDDTSPEYRGRFHYTGEKDPETGMFGRYEPIESEIVNFVQFARKNVGIMTNLDALKCECARFFIHADDNELFTGKGSEENKSEYETESCTYDRICEIVFKYLVKKGRIRPDDKDFRNEMMTSPEYLTRWEREHEYLYDFSNRKSLTWQDFVDNTLTSNMHEG